MTDRETHHSPANAARPIAVDAAGRDIGGEAAICMTGFGASGSHRKPFEKYNITEDAVADAALKRLGAPETI